jgi:hypothetical protein
MTIADTCIPPNSATIGSLFATNEKSPKNINAKNNKSHGVNITTKERRFDDWGLGAGFMELESSFLTDIWDTPRGWLNNN